MKNKTKRGLGADAIDRLITQQLADRKAGRGKDKNKFENAVAAQFRARKRRLKRKRLSQKVVNP